jgi:UDP-glucose 4-epimerase
MKIVVTGGAGFIASHIVDAYLQEGHEVHVIDDVSTGRKLNLNSNAVLHESNIADAEAAKIIQEIKPDVLNHHAAQMDVRHSVEDPLFDAGVNILGFLNLLEACKKAGTARVIFASSGGAIYGDEEPIPADEDHPKKPMSPYGISKMTGELYLAYYYMAFGMRYVALRYANVYGPRQSSKGEAGVVAIFISRLLADSPPTINGDGKQTRDYVFVGDVVRANVAALETSHVGGINIGTGRETDVLTLCRMLQQGAHSKVEAVHGPAKTGEQMRSCLDFALAGRVLDWRPEVDVEEGLIKTISYYRKTSFHES